MNTSERIREQYAKHVKAFVKDIKGLESEGIPAPHIPIAGENYDESQYKIAFMGMETYGWGSMHDFIKAVEENAGDAVLMYKNWYNGKEVLKQNGNATFWGFVIRFMQRFYKIDEKKILDCNNPHPTLTSIVWGNTNAIERYCVTAKPKGVNHEVWHKVKESSKRLDSINHLIEAAHPKVVILTYKWVDKDYILKEKAIGDDLQETKKFAITHQPDPNVPYQYYYLREQDTHVFVIPHPKWIGLYSGIGFDGYIDSIMHVMEEYKIWRQLPSCDDDWKIKKKQPSSRGNKYHLIAELAKLLVSNDMVMSGQELQQIFNFNKIKTSYGLNYGQDGGRGIHKVLSSAWKYYYTKGDVQTALNIARAFTGKYGEYTY